MAECDRSGGRIHPLLIGVMGVVALIAAMVVLALRPVGSGGAPASPNTAATPRSSQLPQPARIQPASPSIAPHLMMWLESQDGAYLDYRTARTTAVHVPQGEAISPFVPAGPCVLSWTGYLNIELRDRFRFRYEGVGRVKVLINDQQVLAVDHDSWNETIGEPVRLGKGAHEFLVTYASPDRGDATVRITWASTEFPFEPIPAHVLTHDAADIGLLKAQRLRRGRELYVSRRCGSCHLGGPTPSAGGVPELAADAPVLINAGDRLNAAWMADWLADPRSQRHDATMPRFFSGADGAAKAADAAAYLASLTLGGESASPDRSTAAIKRGGERFAKLGCIGCHTIGDIGDPDDEPRRLALDHVGLKFKPPALRDFLINPQQYHVWSRMPNFNLTSDEANDLAAFLLDRAADDSTAAFSGDAQRGQQIVASAGCANCHGLPVANTFIAPSFNDIRTADWQRGCVAPGGAARGRAPDLYLNEADRNALIAFFNDGLESLQRRSDLEFAQRQVEQLRCIACHDRDGQVSLWSRWEKDVAKLVPSDNTKGKKRKKAEEEPIEQTRPALTAVGAKLHAGWMTRLLSGELDYKPRPWLEARMPTFGTHAASLARGLAMAYGYSPDGDRATQPRDEAVAEIGRALIEKRGGFGCIDCHAIGEHRAQAVFEAEGVNFAYTAERLQRDYFMRWVLNPQRIHPQTRMPRYADDEGFTPLIDVLDGDGRAQFAAIWEYLRAGREVTPP